MSKELTTETKKSVIEFMAGKYGMERAAFEAVIKETVMPGNVKNEEFVAFLSVAKEYDLNPLIKEIYAFAKGGRVIPIVPIDGWSTIINRRPEMDGVEFNDVVENGKIVSIECKIYRKDRSKPICATEYLEECQMDSNPAWKKWPRRMLRHKAMIQAARYAFGLGGIYDPDEGERIKEVIDVTPKSKTVNAHTPPAALQQAFQPEPVQTDIEEHVIEVSESEDIEQAAFDRISKIIPTLANVKALERYWDTSAKEDLELLNKNAPKMYADLHVMKINRALDLQEVK